MRERSHRMKNGHERTTEILLYLDNALVGRELEDFGTHLAACSICQKRLEKERTLSTMLHEVRPLYPAPRVLRESVDAAAQAFLARSCELNCHRVRCAIPPRADSQHMDREFRSVKE